MSKPRQEINPVSGERLKQFCKKYGITQLKLSAVIDVTPNTLSKICTGKAPLTYRVANEIVKHYPQVRREWLMGIDDFETETKKSLAEFSCWKNEWERRLDAVQILAYLAGYEINLFEQNEGPYQIEKAIENIKEGYKIIKDGKVLATCTLERFNLLALDCQELVEQRIKSYVREVSD